VGLFRDTLRNVHFVEQPTPKTYLWSNTKGRKKPMLKTIFSWILKSILSKAMFGVILFLSAGTLRWTMAWVYLAIFLAFDIATAILVAPRHSDLLVERTKFGKNTAGWDKILARVVAAYGPFITWIIAGLQFQYNWQPTIPMTWQWAAAGLTAVAYGLIAWSMACNAFFAVTARLQPERGHKVATGGPYGIIRHPGYLGAVLFSLTIPVMLGSVWALIPGAITSALYVLRTSLEDKMLQAELPGYKEYTRKTPWRLIPKIW
jgi:protein-S-isoprenylcysteine O-methyltransferase Ste14